MRFKFKQISRNNEIRVYHIACNSLEQLVEV